jgi:hypothetical protein
MAPRSDRPVGDENDAAAVPAVNGGPVIVPDPEAAETGGPKMIRVRHNDVFVYDSEAHAKDANEGVVTGTWRQYPANQAKAIIETAERNGARLAVADVEKKG